MKKSQKTRVLSLLLALVLVFSLCPAALADLDLSDYSDVKEDHWAYDNIMYCSEWNIVKGYDDGRFCPQNPVSGVEFVTMITRTFYADEVAAAQSEKPADGPWYWANLKVAADEYLTTGMTIDGNAMNRYDMANVAKNVIRVINSGKSFPTLNLQDAVPSQVKDWDSVPNNRTVAIKACYATGVITGMSDSKFHGEESMTRAQACVVITRMLNVINGETPGVPSAPQQPAQPETPQPAGSGKLANGQPATVENVWAILDQIKQEYPEGTSWGDSSVPGTNYYADAPTANSGARDVSIGVGKFGAISYKYACGGWMCMVSERIFGKTGAPTREVTDITKARPGDIVVIMSNDGWSVAHVCIFLGYEPARDEQYGDYTLHREPSFYTCDGNMGGEVFWDEIDGIGLRQLNEDLSDLRNSYGQKIHILTRYPD